jgi:hypothetical protein
LASTIAIAQLQGLRLPARAISIGTRIADVTGVALKGSAMIGGTGALPSIAKLREATDEVNKNTEGDEATGAVSSPLVFYQQWAAGSGQWAVALF